MSRVRAILARLRGSLRTTRDASRDDADLREEMEAHVAMHAADEIRRGVPEAEAWRRARVAAGGVTQAAEAAREQQRLPLLELLRAELGAALNPRTLLHHRTFAIAVVLSLGVGISSAASVFAVVESMRHGPLPFRHAERVERLYLQHQGGGRSWELSPRFLTTLQDPASPFAEAAAFQVAPLQLRDGERLARAFGFETTSNYLSLLGVRMVLGRAYSPSDAGDAPSIVISEPLWAGAFARDSAIVGKTVAVNGVPRTVLGVVARETVFPDLAEAWVNSLAQKDTGRRETLGIVASLRPGTSADEARAWVATRGTALLRESNPRGTVRVASMGLRDYFAGGLSRLIFMLTLIAVFMALITAVNFAALMLARGIRRRAELGVRAALGASVPRLVRQLVAECVLICAVGGALAACLAPAAFRLLASTFEEFQPAWLTVSLGWRTVGASALLSVGIGIVFGLGPAIDLARPALAGFLRNAGATATDAGSLVRVRSRLVAIQVALAVAIVVALGTMFGDALMIGTPDAGFDAASVVRGTVADSSFPGSSAFAASTVGLLDDAQRVPGVERSALVEWQYGGGPQLVARVGGETRTAMDAGMPMFTHHRVSESFFDVMRPRVLAGRLPRADELRRGDGVAVVTKRLAATLFDGDAVGHQLTINGANGMTTTVVGVIDDVRERVFAVLPPPMVFTGIGSRNERVLTLHQWELWTRVSGSIPAAVRTLRIRAANHQLGGAAVFGLESMASMRQRDLTAFRAIERMILGMFAVALALASLGIYGLVAYTAETRSRELAIREALGDGRLQIALRIVRGALTQTVCGALGGALLAALFVHYMSEYQLTLRSALPSSAVALGVIAITVLVASIGPLMTTWRRDLAQTLRANG